MDRSSGGFDDYVAAAAGEGSAASAAHETRTIPIPPQLVKLLRAHIKRYGTTADGRIF